MTTLQILKSNNFSPFRCSDELYYARKRSWILGEDFAAVKGGVLKRRSVGGLGSAAGKRLRVFCAVKGDGNKSNGEEPPESLFMKELRRRGMNPTSILEESKRGSIEVDDEFDVKEKEAGTSRRSMVSTNFEPNLSDQRERSMSLNSEGLEGLIPRAKLLLTLGGTFFLAFRPLILTTIAIFSAIYFYFGTTFIHDGTDRPVTPPPYVDPYSLLEADRITQTPLR